MGRKRQATRLNIWLNGRAVGHWDLQRGQSILRYDDAWLDDERARPLSLSMPFRPGNAPYSGAVVTSYFDNLLPDSADIRRRLAQRFHTEGTEPHQLLAAIGKDCVGAIQLLPDGETANDLFSIRGEQLGEGDIAALLRATVAGPGLGQSDEEDLRLSIAGAQEKTALLRHGNAWLRPAGSTPTTHIFKLPMGLVGARQADMRTSVENEWLCAQLLKEFGIPVANCQLARFEDLKVLVVERFDRRLSSDGSWIIRLPQEDFCQATGVPPSRKYQSDGGPGIGAIMDILLGSQEASADRTTFFKAQLLFWLLAATDGHAKNFSIFLLSHSRFRMTPLYDVLSAHPIIGAGRNQLPPSKVKMAMAVRGSENHDGMAQITRRHWLKQAQHAGLGSAAAESIIADLLGRVDAVADQVASRLPEGFPADLADAIFGGLKRHAARLAADG